ncbi:lipocalin family protein [Ichthyenterobacterium sp. W332]|uniref:Lipocalin family protein n=1 Tax=Microcosmobacter mediterraneus TaxID=3075607 RepID=A0ABU2YFY7_9FLAO|nr:lipocalin family protein [Ichthyenterobacterium sp. W332]MDT0557089.1 lipocalin family protein [Ichthyenterobacterium sp. W332]
MKTLKSNSIKLITVFCLSVLLSACSNDDDSSSGDQQTTLELLTSDTWYQESRTPGTFTDCEKNSSFKFNSNNTLNVESFEDDAGTCESTGMVSATYTLSGDDLTIMLGPDTIMATINSVSETTLSVTDDEGETVVFDKTQG